MAFRFGAFLQASNRLTVPITFTSKVSLGFIYESRTNGCAAKWKTIAGLTLFMNFDTPEWMLFEQIDECEELSKFLESQKWKTFSQGEIYMRFVEKYPTRNVVINK